MGSEPQAVYGLALAWSRHGLGQLHRAPSFCHLHRAPPVMTYAQLESLINKWSLELEDQEKHFLQQATQVNAWDRTLIENGEKVGRKVWVWQSLALELACQGCCSNSPCEMPSILFSHVFNLLGAGES